MKISKKNKKIFENSVFVKNISSNLNEMLMTWIRIHFFRCVSRIRIKIKWIRSTFFLKRNWLGMVVELIVQYWKYKSGFIWKDVFNVLILVKKFANSLFKNHKAGEFWGVKNYLVTRDENVTIILQERVFDFM